MNDRTWIRVEDAFGQFDHDKSRPLREGVTPVKDYPEHVGPWARPTKPRTGKDGKAAGKPRARQPRKSRTTAPDKGASTETESDSDTSSSKK